MWVADFFKFKPFSKILIEKLLTKFFKKWAIFEKTQRL